MNAPVFFTHLRAESRFLILATLALWMFAALCNCIPGSLPLLTIYVAGTVLLAYYILKLSGYFQYAVIRSRKSDLLLLMFSILAGGILQEELLRMVLDQPIWNYQTIVTSAPLFAVCIFIADRTILKLTSRLSNKRRIALILSDDQKKALLSDLKALKLMEEFSFISEVDLFNDHYENLKELSAVIISRKAVKEFDRKALLMRAHLAGIPVLDYQSVSASLSGRIKLRDLDYATYLLEATPQRSVNKLYMDLKPVLEPVAAAFLLLMLAPLAALIALLIKLTDRGPVIYKQRRTGYLGIPFTLYKFRTMRIDAEKDGPQWAKDHDSRVTKIGRFLRATRLDEIPQLWNIICGEMSFFGPRPERPEMVEKLSEKIPLFHVRTIVRPGMTGWAQVCAGYANSVAESRIKLEFDLYYIQHMSPRLDLIIMLKTIKVVFFGSSANERRLRLVRSELLEATGL
ncbi:MAG: exopolysaccharide biosynthesis polyprenyl glycosylphosphotransferase [Candidatus Dadabacteria bacterium]|nr:MAG: exopolysaccharide biosynthesis polyprenyl glycosylphosphotransferase [Candidatus Dadabacteria bacterium]